MSRVICADMIRMYRGKWFWLCLGGMLCMACALVGMQYGAMDYEVPLSRVIYLPMSFYGVALAALVSIFVGTDFSDGFIRNKLIAGRSRGSIFFAGLFTIWTACVAIYLVVTIFTFGVGYGLFERDITAADFMQYTVMGILMCLAYGSIFSTITMLCGKRTTAVVLCMGLAFLMLFLCLHTNQIMVQPQYKDGALNPHYAEGVKKQVYALLHDLNPSGQAAQLSTMKIFSTVRWVICDLAWIVAAGLGAVVFRRLNIR